MDEEVDFILSTAGQYLVKAPTRDDVLSVFAGIRPLVRATNNASTASLSRDHVIHIDRSGLVSVMGGKWTTYRHMAEDCVDQAATLAQLPESACVNTSSSYSRFSRRGEAVGCAAGCTARTRLRLGN